MIKKFSLQNNLELEIYQDNFPESPRVICEQLTHLFCFHKKHNLGDKHSYNYNDFTGWDAFKKQLEKDYDIASIFPVFLYDHSGISISINYKYPYDCKWDAGQIGFIFITKKDLKQVITFEKITEKVKERARKIVKEEIREYNYYLQGEVFYFNLIEKKECECCHVVHKEIVDSCGGFYGWDIEQNGMLDCLGKEISHQILQQL